MRAFVPHPLLRRPHLMTLAGALWPRYTPRLPTAQERLFDVAPGTQLLAKCHWQVKRDSPALVLVHGLEGSSESSYMRGTAEKAFLSGFHVLRLNQRNCGGSDRLTPTVYNSGLSGDFRAVLEELIARDGLRSVCFAGFSMGGNLVLKMAGELGDSAPAELRRFVGIAPAFDLAACADALGQPRNFLYERHFVRRLKARMRRKTTLFPGKFPVDGMRDIRSVRDFDDVITARFCGFASADDYYARSSARQMLANIRRPTLIVTAADDPFVPVATFADAALKANPNITLVAPAHGGHCAFISQERGAERFWVEARIVEFCRGVLEAEEPHP
jgi:uncharacterized protein